MPTDIISTGLLSDLSVREKQAAQSAQTDSSELGQDVFLELMVTQMQNQNPLEPQSNSEFVAQLAQFSSVEGIDKLNTTMESIAGSFQSSQALQASSMVGRTVKIDSSVAYLEEGGIVAGTIYLPQSTNDLKMVISDTNGEQVAEVLMGPQQADEIQFSWDGAGQDGEQLGAGEYEFQVFSNQGGDPIQVGTALSANVDSVTVGANGTFSLNITGRGSLPLSAVREIL